MLMWNGIIDGGPASADRTMTAKPDKALIGSLLKELLRQFVCRQGEGDIHIRPAVLNGMSGIKTVTFINRIIDQFGFLLVLLLYLGHAALILSPF